jgi:hypothetical protein
MKQGFNQAAQAMLVREGVGKSHKPVLNASSLLNTLSLCFDRGAKDDFFKAWKQLL